MDKKAIRDRIDLIAQERGLPESEAASEPHNGIGVI
jgi:hypothetical protein